MTIILCLLTVAAFYFDWHPASAAIIAACTSVALALDTRAALMPRKRQS